MNGSTAGAFGPFDLVGSIAANIETAIARCDAPAIWRMLPELAVLPAAELGATYTKLYPLRRELGLGRLKREVENESKRLGAEMRAKARAEAAANADTAPLPPEFSEENLALRFSDQHAEDLRYVAAWGRWMRWRGHVWRHDDTLSVFDSARAICRDAATEAEAEHQGTAVRVASAKTVAAVEHLARCDRRQAATLDQWDNDLYLLNTPDGAVDLRSGTKRPARRADYCTKSTAVGPGGDCRLWLHSLDQWTAGDKAMQAFLKRMTGYCLTGATVEHALFFAHGSGANGKSVFMSTLAGILGDYSRTAPLETFTETKSERHSCDLASLQGARLVTVAETQEGRAWDESKLKTLTGGDKIAARFMRQDFFEFMPQFKLLVSGNHRPSLRTVDESIRRRFNLLPFSVTIPAAERDPSLTEKLRAEWPGILQWAIDGCLEWQRDRLAAPAIVRDATEAYLSAEDSLAAWMDDRCIRTPKCWTSSAALFHSWKAWCELNREHAGSKKRFGQNLESHGIKPERVEGRGYRGLELKGDA